jgi:hypothetical protein
MHLRNAVGKSNRYRRPSSESDLNSISISASVTLYSRKNPMLYNASMRYDIQPQPFCIGTKKDLLWLPEQAL